ncbi:MAG: hypothetical protein Q8P20_01155 [bacterium]|nr:hypothetical protein [bacterium]
MTKQSIDEKYLNEIKLHINSDLSEVQDSIDLDYYYEDLLIIKLPNEFKKMYVLPTTPKKSERNGQKLEQTTKNLIYCLEIAIEASNYKQAMKTLTEILAIFDKNFTLKTYFWDRLQTSILLLQKLI